MCRFASPPAVKLLAQLLAGAMEHDPKIAFGDVHLRADFVIRPLLDLVELKYLRDARRQFTEGEFQILAKFG